ncbi:hypothetical protein CEXT_407091 [Caerostris extrusa]|uniref:Uncharacterized protein n=1 Tax=Caerostris extrusa TaxID=172846 RepID=A0AAV4XH92_CAEEX|nr:hypothetical protein CEXT_407091 [Caerostris extrusa]
MKIREHKRLSINRQRLVFFFSSIAHFDAQNSRQMARKESDEVVEQKKKNYQTWKTPFHPPPPLHFPFLTQNSRLSLRNHQGEGFFF